MLAGNPDFGMPNYRRLHNIRYAANVRRTDLELGWLFERTLFGPLRISGIGRKCN